MLKIKREDTYPTLIFRFAIPFGEKLEIRCSKDISDMEIAINEEIPDVYYYVFWNDEILHAAASKQIEALAIAMGAQWGCFEMFKRLGG